MITADKALSDWFDGVLDHTAFAKRASNLMMGEMMRLLSETNLPLHEIRITPQMLGQLVNMIEAGKISMGAGKQVFEILFHEGGDPEAIVEEKGLGQVSNDDDLERWANEAIEQHPKPVSEYQAGNAASINFLMGQVMKASRGKANPAAVMQMLKEKLDA